MNAYKPERLPQTEHADPIDVEIDKKCEAGPRCIHCGFERTRMQDVLCLTCVRKLVRGLVKLTDGRTK